MTSLSDQFNTPSAQEVAEFLSAARNGRQQTLKQFIEVYGDKMLLVEDNDKNNALIWATFGEHHDMTLWLLDKGAKDDKFRTAYLTSKQNGWPDVVAEFEARSEKGFSQALAKDIAVLQQGIPCAVTASPRLVLRKPANGIR